MNKKFRYLLLLLIIIAGLGLRFFRLKSAPTGAQVDEAHFGYIAYSLFETGRDEHARRWPLVFTGFGDDKLPLQTYLLVPAVGMLGLNNLSIRLVSALSGVGLIVVSYFLSKQLTKHEETALLTALITAVTPWSLLMSRFGYESNLALLIFAASLVSLFTFIDKNKLKFLWFAAFLMAATWYTYIAYRLITVLFLALSLISLTVADQIKKKNAAAVFVFFLVLVSPFVFYSSSSNTTRFDQLFTHDLTGITLDINEQRSFCSNHFPRVICDVSANKLYFWLRMVFARVIEAFSPNYLILQGEENLDYLSVKNFGPFLIPAYLLAIYGLFVTCQKKLDHKKLLLALGTIISILPAVLVGDPQRVRMSALLIFLLGWTAFGIKQLLSLDLANLLRSSLILLLTASSLYLGLTYFITLTGVHIHKNDQAFASHLPPTFAKINQLGQEKLVVIKPFFSDPILYYAYFNQVDPAHYQENVVLGEKEESGFQHAVGLDNITVSNISTKDAVCLGVREEKSIFYWLQMSTKRQDWWTK